MILAVLVCGECTDGVSRLALVQMKLLLATLVKGLDVAPAVEQDQSEMEDVQAAVLAPKGGRCLLRFSERKERPSKEVRFEDHE